MSLQLPQLVSLPYYLTIRLLILGRASARTLGSYPQFHKGSSTICHNIVDEAAFGIFFFECIEPGAPLETNVELNSAHKEVQSVAQFNEFSSNQDLFNNGLTQHGSEASPAALNIVNHVHSHLSLPWRAH